MTMVYQYASISWRYESNPPLGAHGAHHAAAEAHETPMPGGAVMTPMATEPNVTATPMPEPEATATPVTEAGAATPTP